MCRKEENKKKKRALSAFLFLLQYFNIHRAYTRLNSITHALSTLLEYFINEKKIEREMNINEKGGEIANENDELISWSFPSFPFSTVIKLTLDEHFSLNYFF